VTVAADGGINAVGGGYQHRAGPGAGRSGTFNGAGGYGGEGGGGGDPLPGGLPYGPVASPSAPGSGGGSHVNHVYAGGWGGGLVKMTVTGSVTVNGTITANGTSGQDQHGSGGSGGGIYIKCQTLGGTGSLEVRGGSTYNNLGGAGGGGRIALDYQSLGPAHDLRFSAAPGSGSWANTDTNNYWHYRPQAGTMYLPDMGLLTTTFGNRRFDDVRLFFPGTVNWRVDSLVVSNASVTFADSSFRLTVTNNVLVMAGGTLGIGDDTGTNYLLECGGNLDLDGISSLYAYAGRTNSPTPGYGTLVDVGGTMSLWNGSWVYPVAHKTNGASVLFQMGNLFIDDDAGFNASAKGYMARFGPGRGSLNNGSSSSGAGFGGSGQESGIVIKSPGGLPYGSYKVPAECGSGGGTYPNDDWYRRGGSGGGCIRIDTPGTFTLNGKLLADGGKSMGAQHGGAGSGGGIYVVCGPFFAGPGSRMSAKGGMSFVASVCGSGGGGRIALWSQVIPEERTRIMAGQKTRQTTVTNVFTEVAPMVVSVTNGLGYVSTNLATSGTAWLFLGHPPGGTMLVIQ